MFQHYMHFQWLAIAPGAGGREYDILKNLKDKNPQISIDLLEAYEPNNDTCSFFRRTVADSKKQVCYQMF